MVSSGLSPASVSIQSRIQVAGSMASSAGSSTGYSNRKPTASSRVGVAALAREQQRLDELATEPQFQGKHGRGQHRRAMEHVAERVGEVGVGHRIRGGEDDRARAGVRRRSRRASRRRGRGARSSSSTACPIPACRRGRAGTATACSSAHRRAATSTMPVRRLTVRTPASTAGRVSASHALQTPARKSLPGALSSVRISSPRLP